MKPKLSTIHLLVSFPQNKYSSLHSCLSQSIALTATLIIYLQIIFGVFIENTTFLQLKHVLRKNYTAVKQEKKMFMLLNLQ